MQPLPHEVAAPATYGCSLKYLRLQAAAEADLLLHVLDASSPFLAQQRAAVQALHSALQCITSCITVRYAVHCIVHFMVRHLVRCMVRYMVDDIGHYVKDYIGHYIGHYNQVPSCGPKCREAATPRVVRLHLYAIKATLRELKLPSSLLGSAIEVYTKVIRKYEGQCVFFRLALSPTTIRPTTVCPIYT